MEIPPGRMLEALGELILRFELFRYLPEGSAIYRARVHDPGDSLTTPDELGPPPRELAGMSNRMSPAGIPMFYGAFDERTAVAETVDPAKNPTQVVTVAQFDTSRPLFLLDLTELPPVPSPFHEEERYLRKPISFLRAFSADLTKPILRDGYEHVEYVPTQVVTEFIRHRLTTEDGTGFDGIQYRSSRDTGGIAIVVFCDRHGCGPRERRPFDSEVLLRLKGFEQGRPDAFSAVGRSGAS